MTMLRNYAVRWTTIPDQTIKSYDEYTDNDRGHIRILKDTLYRHAKLTIQYVTYDTQVAEDTLYAKEHPGIMVICPDSDGHPYLYGRILDIFHMEVENDGGNALFVDNGRIRVDMVWVHWYECNQRKGPSSFNSLRYPSISLCPDSEPESYGLIHPDEIVRRVHLIQDFDCIEDPDDYRKAQVNMYVRDCSPMCCMLTSLSLADRDMFMRFRGGAVGHLHMREIDEQLDRAGWGSSWPSLKDRDPEPDVQDVAYEWENSADEASVEGGSNNSESDDEELRNLVDGDGEDKERPMPDGEDEVEDDDSIDESEGGLEEG